MTSVRVVLDDQICSHCGNVYDNGKYIPKILNCGHTVCLRCVTERIKTCPGCSESIKEPVSELPTNLAIPELPKLGSLENLEVQRDLLKDIIKKDWQIFNETWLFEHYEETSSISSLDTSINESTASQLDPHVFSSMAEDEIRCTDDSTLPLHDIRFIQADFSITSHTNKAEFINKIVAELLQGNKIHSFDYSGDDIFWGRLSYEDGKLYIHSLTSGVPTMPLLIVHFTDLKDCLEINNFQTFIDISGCQIACNMVSSSPLSYYFLNLCYGGGGTSFKEFTPEIKHFSDKRQDIISFKINKPSDIDRCKFLLHSLPSETRETFEDDRLQIKMWEDKCEIIMNPEISSSDECESDGVVVASGISSAEVLLELSSEGGTCVEDCGLIVLLSSDQQNALVAATLS